MWQDFGDQFIREQKRLARELRHSRWWQNKIANALCYYCGIQVSANEATMDHIVPLSRGGKSTKGNVVVACKGCNNQKKDQTVFDWPNYRGELSGINLAHTSAESKQKES